MRVKFVSNSKLDTLENVVNGHLAGLGRMGHKAKSVDLKITEWNRQLMFTAVIVEECSRDRQEREDFEDVPSYLR